MDLPLELLLVVFSFLRGYDGILVLVCHAWRNAVLMDRRGRVRWRHQWWYTSEDALVQSPSVLRFANETLCWPLNRNMMCTAVLAGCIDSVLFLHEQGVPFDTGDCATAAGDGNLKLLQLLRDLGCPWDQRAAAFAVARKRLAVLEWLKNADCPLGPWVRHHYCCIKNPEIKQWVRDNWPHCLK